MGEALWTINATLIAKGFDYVRPPMVYRGPLQVHGKIVPVEIEIPDAAFVQMPRVRVLDRSKLPVRNVAHLLDDDDICYFGSAGLPLDLYNPWGSVLLVLAEASAALERSFAGGYAAEVERELASYWQGKTLFFSVPCPPQPEVIHAEVIPRTVDKDSGLAVIPKGHWKERGIGGRLPATVLSFPNSLQHTTRFPLRTLGEAVGYIESQPSRPAQWRSALMEATAAGSYIFLSAPNAIIGWLPTFPPSLKALFRRSNGFRPEYFKRKVEGALNIIELDRMTGKRMDLQYCVERNLAGSPSLIGKRVGLVGCGTIGGYLARMLVQNGAGCGSRFSMYDTDQLSAGNLGRHLLGFKDIGRNKAEALASHLREFHPDVEVAGYGLNALDEWSTLETMDLIIDATGEPNVATALNERYISSGRTGAELALLHAYVFGNGVAAQSFLNLRDGYACYRCLKTAFDGQWRHNPLKDASSPLLEVAGTCAEGDYVPFAVDAPVAAAGLALRAALDWAKNDHGHRLRTVVLDYKSGRERMPWASPLKLPTCAACGGA